VTKKIPPSKNRVGKGLEMAQEIVKSTYQKPQRFIYRQGSSNAGTTTLRLELRMVCLLLEELTLPPLQQQDSILGKQAADAGLVLQQQQQVKHPKRRKKTVA
jgi:hypothetical protein